MESIERYGIMNPLIVMLTTEGFYRIISGHRRKYCAEKLGYTKVPVIIRYMKEDDSIISMVDSNLHREKILFSEKVFAYSMKNEAMKRKTGKRRKTQEGLLEALKGTKTIDLIGQEKQLSPQKINEILNEIKKTDMSRVIFKNSQMYKYFPKYYSTEQMKEEIIELLEKEGKKVLLIDADPQGSLSASLGIGEPDALKVTLSTILMNVVNEENIDPEEGIYHHEEGVDLLPGNIELSVMEVSLIS